MFGQLRPGASAYAKVGVETKILAASPYQLVVMMYEATLSSLAKAKQAMLDHDIATKGTHISKAITIINDGLRASLDKSVGGDIAQNLDDLYAYTTRQIMLGHNRNNQALIDEAHKLLSDLHDAWKSMPQPNQLQSEAATRIAEKA